MVVVEEEEEEKEEEEERRCLEGLVFNKEKKLAFFCMIAFRLCPRLGETAFRSGFGFDRDEGATEHMY